MLTVDVTTTLLATVVGLKPAERIGAGVARAVERQVWCSTLFAPIAVAQRVILSSRLLGPRSHAAAVGRSR